jgi:hypothetical protein
MRLRYFVVACPVVGAVCCSGGWGMRAAGVLSQGKGTVFMQPDGSVSTADELAKTARVERSGGGTPVKSAPGTGGGSGAEADPWGFAGAFTHSGGATDTTGTGAAAARRAALRRGPPPRGGVSGAAGS